jgi:DNA-binding MurR/RpiR family transcriptional regulator
MFAYGEGYPEAEVAIAEARRMSIPIVLVSDSLEDRLARQAEVVIPIPRGRTGHMALHGATLVCVEAILLGVVAKDPGRATAALERLNGLRSALRGRRRGG